MNIRKSFKYENCTLWVLILIFMVALAFYGQYLGVDYENDTLNYHLYNGYAFLNGRTFFDLAPAGLHTFFNPILDILSYLGLTKLDTKVFSLISSFVQALNIIPLYLIGKLLLNKFIKNNFLILLLTSSGVFHSLYLAQLGMTMHDNLTAVLVLYALFLFLRQLDRRRECSLFWLLIPMFLMGICTAFKLTNAIFAIALLICYLFFSFIKKNIKIILYPLSSLIFSFLLFHGFWMYKLYKEFGNPIYPYFNNIFQSPLASINPSDTKDSYFFRQKGFAKLFYPLFFSNEPGLVSGYFGWPIHSFYKEGIAYLFCFILAILSFLETWRKQNLAILNEKRIFFLIFSAAAYLVWYLKFGVLRYLMPILLLLPVLITLVYCIIIHNFLINNKNLRIISIVFIFVFLGIFTYKDLKNGFPSNRTNHTDLAYITHDTLKEHDKSAKVYFIDGSPRVWQSWIIPTFELQGRFVPLRSGIFRYETSELQAYKKSIVDKDLRQIGSYPILIRDVTGNSWISKYPSNNESNSYLSYFGYKILDNSCRRYRVNFSGAKKIVEFCDLQKYSQNSPKNNL